MMMLALQNYSEQLIGLLLIIIYFDAHKKFKNSVIGLVIEKSEVRIIR